MTKVNQTVAAVMVGKSRPKLNKDTKDGALSREADGRYDVSELMRVYGSDILTVEQAEAKIEEGKAKKGGKSTPDKIKEDTSASEILILKERLQMKEELLAEKDSRIKELAEERDDYKEEAKSAKERETRLLTDQRKKEEDWQGVIATVAELKANQDKFQAEQDRGFFGKLFGRKKA